MGAPPALSTVGRHTLQSLFFSLSSPSMCMFSKPIDSVKKTNILVANLCRGGVYYQLTSYGNQVSLKGGQVFDTLELGMIAAARGYGVSMGDLLMVAEDVAQGRLSLPWPTAVASGENYYLVWPKTRPGGERLRRLAEFLQGEVQAMVLPVVERLD